jgi:hypothetical protein
MAAAVYMLCFLTSLACAVLLLRSYRRQRTRLLLWSSLCFIGLALNNGLLFVDFVIVPAIDLYYVRTVPVLVGLVLLIIGFTQEVE